MAEAIAQGTAVPPEVAGPLLESCSLLEDAAQLRRQLAADGYLFLKGVVDRETVMAARREVFERLEEVGEILPPAQEGIASGSSRRREQESDLGAFWRSVSQGARLRAASHGDQMQAVMDLVLGEPAQAHDYIFLRPGAVGRSTSLHYDHPFFSRGSDRVHTAWLALGDIPLEDGPLMVLEGSNRYADLIEQARKVDYDSNDTATVQVLTDTVEFARQRGGRLLMSPVEAGDLIVFDMFTMHGSLDNHSPLGRVRLSCDVRWQPAADPVDPRYRGDHPPGTTGAGYGELNGAKPLDLPWHVR